MTITDWSAAEAGQVAALYSDEAERWRSAFDWDTAAQWREVEHARTRWSLPGLVARHPDGRVAGWLYYLTAPDGAQLGGVSADDAGTAGALVRQFAARMTGARITGFMPALAPGLDAALDQAGFDVTPHLYLTRSLVPPTADQARIASSSPATMRAWRDGDVPLAARVLHDAYDPAEAALFAADGTPEAWLTYVTSLVEQIGCGQFLPGASLITESGGEAVGAAILTRLSERMVHLAQIGVSRDRQGSGDGARLLTAAMSLARGTGAEAISLLVSSRNAGALRFYGRHGFTVRGRFLEIVGARRAPAVRR